jgi:hypothetical protein
VKRTRPPASEAAPSQYRLNGDPWRECGAQIRYVNQAEADKRAGMTWEVSCRRMGLHPNTVREWRAERPALEAKLAAARSDKRLGVVKALRQQSGRGARYPDMEVHVNDAITERRDCGFKVSAVGVAAGRGGCRLCAGGWWLMLMLSSAGAPRLHRRYRAELRR